MPHHKNSHKNDGKSKSESGHKDPSEFSDQGTLSPWTESPKPAGETAQTQKSPAAPPTETEVSELKKKATERDEYLDLLQRTRADYLNYIKRAQKDRAETVKYGIQDFAAKVVAVMDDFSRAIASAEKARDFDKFLEGIKLIEAQFEKTLSEADIVPIEAVGKPFDPAQHEAVMQQEDATVPEGTILEEFQRGFMLNDRVLRASRVKVACKPAKAGEQASSPESFKEGEEKKQP